MISAALIGSFAPVCSTFDPQILYGLGLINEFVDISEFRGLPLKSPVSTDFQCVLVYSTNLFNIQYKCHDSVMTVITQLYYCPSPKNHSIK